MPPSESSSTSIPSWLSRPARSRIATPGQLIAIYVSLSSRSAGQLMSTSFGLPVWPANRTSNQADPSITARRWMRRAAARACSPARLTSSHLAGPERARAWPTISTSRAIVLAGAAAGQPKRDRLIGQLRARARAKSVPIRADLF